MEAAFPKGPFATALGVCRLEMELAQGYPWLMREPAEARGALPVSDPDARDIQRFREGDDSAFEALVKRREREISQVAWRSLGDPEDAREAAQETFLRAYRALPKFRGEASFRTWLTGIALNVCRNRAAAAEERVRRHSQSTDCGEEEEAPAAPALPDPSPSPESRALGGELKEALGRALLALSAEHREILVLREIQGMDYDEMAVVLGLPVGTVKSRLGRARQALREHLRGVWP